MKKIYYVTENEMKIAVARNSLEPHGFEVEQIKMETPEIQDINPSEVAKYSAKYAAEKLGKPVIKCDAGFSIEVLNGFPGAFLKYFNQCLSAEKICHLYQAESNRRANFIDALAYCEPGKEPVCFVSNTYGTMIDEPRGKSKYAIEPIFVPQGYQKTLAEMTKEDVVDLWSNSRYEQLVSFLKS